MRFAAAPPSAPSSTATPPALPLYPSLSLSYRKLSCRDSHACQNRAITYVYTACTYIYLSNLNMCAYSKSIPFPGGKLRFIDVAMMHLQFLISLEYEVYQK